MNELTATQHVLLRELNRQIAQIAPLLRHDHRGILADQLERLIDAINEQFPVFSETEA